VEEEGVEEGVVVEEDVERVVVVEGDVEPVVVVEVEEVEEGFVGQTKEILVNTLLKMVLYTQISISFRRRHKFNHPSIAILLYKW